MDKWSIGKPWPLINTDVDNKEEKYPSRQGMANGSAESCL